MKKVFYIILAILIASIIFYKLTNCRNYGYASKSPDGKFTIEIYSTRNLITETFDSFFMSGRGHGGSGWTKAYAILLDKNGNKIGDTGNVEFLCNEIEISWELPNEVYIKGAGSFNLKTSKFINENNNNK